MRTILLICLCIFIKNWNALGQNMTAEFINLPNLELDEVVLSDSDTCFKICQYKSPNTLLDFGKMYFSVLNTNKKKFVRSDSLKINRKLLDHLGSLVDFLVFNEIFYLLGTKNILIVDTSKIIAIIPNDQYQRFLLINKDIYLARNFSTEKRKETFQFCKIHQTKELTALEKCLNPKQFILENTFSVYSSINYTTSNLTNTIFSVNFFDNSIDLIKPIENTIIKQNFSTMRINKPDSSIAKNCIRLYKKYGFNNSYSNLDALIASTDSLIIVTSISAHGENTILINLQNRSLRNNWFSQLLCVKINSKYIDVKDISWDLTQYSKYPKNKVPYYTYGRRQYAAGERWFVLPSNVDETKLLENFTLSDYQKQRDSYLKVKSVILVEINPN